MGNRPSRSAGARFQEIVEVDFFSSPLQKKLETLLARAETSSTSEAAISKIDLKDYVGRVWVASATSRDRPLSVSLVNPALRR